MELNDPLYPRASFVVPLSPRVQYGDLNYSLADQVIDTKKNLLSSFDDPACIEPQPDVVGHECIKVFLRVRPFLESEIGANENQDCVEIKSRTVVVMRPPVDSAAMRNALAKAQRNQEIEFTFSQIFPSNATQKSVFDEVAKDYVANLLLGQSGLIFTYGVTNAGKTYTVQGTTSEPGILPQSLEYLFNLLNGRLVTNPDVQPKLFDDCVQMDAGERKKLLDLKAKIFSTLDTGESDIASTVVSCSTNSSVQLFDSTQDSQDNGLRLPNVSNMATSVYGDTYEYSIWISFYEIYKEVVYDLLVPVGSDRVKRRVKVCEDRVGNVYVKDLVEVFVCSAEEALQLALIGKKNLRYAATKLNFNSSRSHCIFNIRMVKHSSHGGEPPLQRTTTLSFCDLAGSERTTKTGNTGERLKEAGNINTSLLALGRCIQVLRRNQGKRNNPLIIPFRDSKLTRLFQRFLFGRAKACMIVNINQCASNFDETLHALHFSAIAKQVIIPTEPEREPPPPPKFSMLLDAHAANRQKTMCWTTERDLISFDEIEKQAVATALPDDDDDNDIDVDVDVDDDANYKSVDECRKVIKCLKKKLSEEARKNATLEDEIRNEFGEAYARILDNMERRFSDRRREDVEATQALADRRLELYMQSVGTRRTSETSVSESDTEDDAYITTSAYQDKEKECELLKKELEEMTTKFQEQCQKIEQIQAETEQLNAGRSPYVLIDAKPQLGNVEVQTEDFLPDSSYEAKELIELRKEVSDLNEMLEEAGESFTQQQEEISRLTAEIIRLRSFNFEGITETNPGNCLQVPEHSKIVEQSMHQPISPAIVDVGSVKEADESSQVELKAKIADLERMLQAAKQRIEELQKLVEDYPGRDSQLTAKLQELEKENQTLKNEIQSAGFRMVDVERRLTTATAVIEKQTLENQNTIDTLQDQLAKLQRLNEETSAKLAATSDALEQEKLASKEVSADSVSQLDAMRESVAQLESEKLTETNTLLLTLNEARTEVVRLKKEKLEIEENAKFTADECRKLNDVITGMRAEMLQLKDTNQKSNEESDRNSQVIQDYKSAIVETAEVQEQLAAALDKKKQELDNVRTELRDAVLKCETAEQALQNQQAKCSRLKIELDAKILEHQTLKTDYAMEAKHFARVEAENLAIKNQLMICERDIESLKIDLRGRKVFNDPHVADITDVLAGSDVDESVSLKKGKARSTTRTTRARKCRRGGGADESSDCSPARSTSATASVTTRLQRRAAALANESDMGREPQRSDATRSLLTPSKAASNVMIKHFDETSTDLSVSGHADTYDGKPLKKRRALLKDPTEVAISPIVEEKTTSKLMVDAIPEVLKKVKRKKP